MNEKVICWTCVGRGERAVDNYKTCEPCVGSGQVEDLVRSKYALKKCSRCQGHGGGAHLFTCKTCGGTGELTVTKHGWATCGNCDGQGSVLVSQGDCWYCEGRGRVCTLSGNERECTSEGCKKGKQFRREKCEVCQGEKELKIPEILPERPVYIEIPCSEEKPHKVLPGDPTLYCSHARVFLFPPKKA